MKNTCAKFGPDTSKHGGAYKEHTHIHTYIHFYIYNRFVSRTGTSINISFKNGQKPSFVWKADNAVFDVILNCFKKSFLITEYNDIIHMLTKIS